MKILMSVGLMALILGNPALAGQSAHGHSGGSRAAAQGSHHSSAAAPARTTHSTAATFGAHPNAGWHHSVARIFTPRPAVATTTVCRDGVGRYNGHLTCAYSGADYRSVSSRTSMAETRAMGRRPGDALDVKETPLVAPVRETPLN